MYANAVSLLQSIRNNGENPMRRSVNRAILTSLLAVFLSLSFVQTSFASDATQAKADLTAVKKYLVDKAVLLRDSAAGLKKAADTYYELAKAEKFDYAALWKNKSKEVAAALKDAKTGWVTSSPLYEQIEGIVAGVPALEVYDPILDSGVKDEVEYDLTLPDNIVLKKPGNLFGLLETSLWGTDTATVKQTADLDGNGKLEFGEALPDANLVKGYADGMAKYTEDLVKDAEKWTPTEADAFTALVRMVPTMKEYYSAWKNSRFVLGDKAESGEFSVISRLSDIADIVGSLEVVYEGVRPLVVAKDPALDKEIATGLTDLRTTAADLLKQEQDGKKFTPEQADLYATQEQANADAITGKIAQVAAQLNIKIEE
jgi:hypothetical protein